MNEEAVLKEVQDRVARQLGQLLLANHQKDVLIEAQASEVERLKAALSRLPGSS